MAIEINKKICPPGLNTNPNRKMASIEYITIHNTGNYNKTSTSKNHADYQYSGKGSASWHYTVDADEIWQSFEDNSMCWHAGDGSGPGNSTSIGIEICVNDKNRFSKACDNAAYLTALLLKRHNLTIDKVVQHNNWSGKNCPKEIRSGQWGVTWEDFINRVKHYLQESVTPILAPATASVHQACAWAKSKNATPVFTGLAKTYWLICQDVGVNPVIAYCQAAKETGYGKFGGVIDETYFNPCGMKTKVGGNDRHAGAHYKFTSWHEGVWAHVDHLALYAGADGYPDDNTSDPRHFPSLYGKYKTVESLSGSWSTSKTYGEELLKMIKDLESRAAPAIANTGIPVWQEDAFKSAVTDGVIATPEYWENRLTGPMTTAEVIAIGEAYKNNILREVDRRINAALKG